MTKELEAKLTDVSRMLDTFRDDFRTSQAALADAQDAIRARRAAFEELDRVTRGQIARQGAELQVLRANLTSCQQDNTRLVLAYRAASAERESFYVDYRLKCDEESKAAVARAEQAEARLNVLRRMPAGWRMNAAHLSVRQLADSVDRWFRDGMPLPGAPATSPAGGE